MGGAELAFTIFFVIAYALFFLIMFGGMLAAVLALVSAARLPAEAFGPWWDNTKTMWLVGIGAGFLIPCGAAFTGVYWFFSGRKALRRTGQVSRPFWAGPPKPPPPQYWTPAYPPPPGPPPPTG